MTLSCVKLTEKLASPWCSGYSLEYIQNIKCIHFLIVCIAKQTHFHLRIDDFYNSVFHSSIFCSSFSKYLGFQSLGAFFECVLNFVLYFASERNRIMFKISPCCDKNDAKVLFFKKIITELNRKKAILVPRDLPPVCQWGEIQVGWRCCESLPFLWSSVLHSHPASTSESSASYFWWKGI